MAKNEVKINISADSSKAGEEIKKTSSALDELGNEAEQSAAKLKGFAVGTVLFNELAEAAGRLSSLVESIADLSDAYRMLESRISNAVGSQEEAARIMGEIEAIAQRTHAPLQSVGELYARLRQNIEQTSASNEELLQFTEAVGNAMRVSGTSASEASGALLQLSQALASGTLRGDEFNSVNEQMPVIMSAVAKQMGVTKGELRGLAEQGKITADVVKAAVLNMADDWQQAAENMPVTLKQSLADLESAWQSYLGQSDGVGQATQLITEAIGGLADNLGDLIEVAGDAALAAMPALFIKISQSIAANIVKLKEYAVAQREAAVSAKTSAAAEAAAAKEAALAQEILAKARLHVAQTAVTAKAAALEAAKAAEAEALANQKAAAEVKLYGQQRVVIEREAKAAIDARRIAEQELALATEQAAIAQRNYIAAVDATKAAEAGRLGVLGKLKGSLKSLLNPMNALNAGMSAWMGWEIGKWARENFTWVRKGAVLALASVMSLKEGVVLLSEAFMALFTSDTVSAAYDRFNERMDKVRENINGMLDDIDAGIDLQDENAGSLKNMGDKAEEAGKHLDVLKTSVSGVNEELHKLTAGEAEAVASWVAIIESATNASEALERTQWAMQAVGDNATAANQINDAYQASISRVGSVADEAAAANARLASGYITQIQNAKTLNDVARATATAMQELGDNTEAQALVSQAAAEKTSVLSNATNGLAKSDASRAKSVAAVTGSIEQNYDAMLRLQTQYDKGEISAAEFNNGISALKEKNDELRDAQRKVNKETKNAADSQRDAAAATEEHNQAITSAISLTHVVRNRYYEMSEAVGKFFDNTMAGVHSIESWWDALSDRRYEQVKKQYEELVQSNDALIRRLKSGAASSEDMRRAQAALAAESINAAHGFIGLGEQELGPLRAALADAQSRMEALRDSAESTLVSLQNELDRLNGNMAAIEQRNYEQKRLELQQKLAEAQAAGDAAAIAALQKSLQILKQIHQVKMANLDADQKAAAATASASGGATNAPQSSRPQTRGSISGTFAGQSASQSKHTIELRDSRGNRTEIGVTDEEQAYKFLDALEKAGLTSI